MAAWRGGGAVPCCAHTHGGPHCAHSSTLPRRHPSLSRAVLARQERRLGPDSGNKHLAAARRQGAVGPGLGGAQRPAPSKGHCFQLCQEQSPPGKTWPVAGPLLCSPPALEVGPWICWELSLHAHAAFSLSPAEGVWLVTQLWHCDPWLRAVLWGTALTHTWFFKYRCWRRCGIPATLPAAPREGC